MTSLRWVWVSAVVLLASCSHKSPPTGTCSPGAKQCSGNGVQTCGANGQWGEPVACSNQACVQGACSGSCAPGATRCSGNGVQTCDATGQFGAASACSHQTCADGACVGVCAPGETGCSGNAPQTCGAGGAWTTGAVCSNQACVNGACVGACAPGAAQCSGNGVQPCSASGTWGAPVACSNQTCVNGACTGVCAPGATQCTGNAAQTCDASGAWGAAVACSNQACVQGACVGVCAPGATQCSGNGVQTCDANGNWGAVVACTNQTCVSGACMGVCASGAVQCQANAVQTCSATGQWVGSTTCSFVCASGQCTGVCVPGDKQCVSGGSETCDSSGNWGSAQACTNQACVAGACAGSCLVSALVAGGLDQAPIPTYAGSTSNGSYTMCPSGSDATATPPLCISEADWTTATLSTSSTDPSKLQITGSLPLRGQDIAISVSPFSGCQTTVTAALDGDASCPGGAYLPLPVSISMQFNASESNSLEIFQVVDDNALANALSNYFNLCGVPSCDSLCCVSNTCQCALAGANYGTLKSAWLSVLMSTIKAQLIKRIELQLCQTSATTCPANTTAGSDTICRYADGFCAPLPSLFGTCP